MPEESQKLLFPPIASQESGFLDVGDGHELYWEISGNMKGLPIVLLHGGPGAGASPIHRQFFDPQIFKIIIFDQRGAGRSKPLGSLDQNTTKKLIDDIETLRQFLSIDRWHVVGGSWGSTLALMYAASYPENCLSLTLRAIFLMQPEEVDWFLYGTHNIFPEAWEKFSGYLPSEKQDDILTAYYELLTCGDKETEQQAGYQWTVYESACARLRPQIPQEQNDQDWALGRIEAHYFLHDDFDFKGHLLNHLDHLRKIPTSIVQGRYDIISPIKTAYWLKQQWPEADMHIVTGGHSMMDPAICKALLETIDNLKNLS